VPQAYSSRVKIHSIFVRGTYSSIIRCLLWYGTETFGSTISATPRKLTIRCPGSEASPPRTQILVNAGLLYDATAYHNSTEDLQMFPSLRRSMQKETNTTRIFMQDKVPINSQHESSQLQELTPPTCSLIPQRLYIRHRFIVFHCTTPIRHLLDLYPSDLDSSYHVSEKTAIPIPDACLTTQYFFQN
jgi:hypothetical protein